MHSPVQRTAAYFRTCLTVLVVLFGMLLHAHAVVVRGTVTTPLGLPIGNARVQLVQGQKVAAFTFTQPDGTFEVRSAGSGRFLLLTSAAPFTPSIGEAFYGGITSVLTRNVTMEYTTVTAQLSSLSSGISTPVQQTPAATMLVPPDTLATEITVTNVLRQAPGSMVVQTGQFGGPVALYVRGGPATGNQVLIDGISASDIGGRFDFSPIATTALDGPELYRGANSALYGTGAEASVVSLATSRTASLRPTLNYTGDAGNFHTYRNQAVLSGSHARIDYLTGFSRINSSNALPNDQYHSATTVANLGYSIFPNTLARFTLRNTDSDAGLPGPHDIYGISASGKQSNQDIYSGITLENQLAGNWHNLARYGISRKREQVQQFAPTGQLLLVNSNSVLYYGAPVTLRGANGYTASGQAAFLLPSYDTVSNRDELYYQSGYIFPHRIAALFSFQYESERGRLLSPAFSPAVTIDRSIKRTNFLYTLQLRGDIKHRLFYSAGGSIEDNDLYGIAGTPRFGLSYAPVRPGRRIFRGTLLRANAAEGVQEPSLSANLTSLRQLLNATGNGAAISAYRVAPISAERSRTFDFGIDQNIVNQKLILRANYFHDQFSHQLEGVNASGLEHYFHVPAPIATQLPSASVNSLAYRTQGLELSTRYQPYATLILDGGYTYLASLVLQSFSGDSEAAANGNATTNPDLPGIAIGALSPLVGSRLFRRPPNTGFFSVTYSTGRFATAIRGALSSRSDDSTFQLNNDRYGGNTLLLPNRDLDFGYARLDANLLFAATRHVTVFTQLDNLLSQQHVGPIGYPGLPFTVRAGMKIRIAGD
ncbi:MAG: TonB-dependent receptor [Acidobacteriota bacterium]|nr:TonB-dependent receptor [Acidobacteriota bacterium]